MKPNGSGDRERLARRTLKRLVKLATRHGLLESYEKIVAESSCAQDAVKAVCRLLESHDIDPFPKVSSWEPSQGEQAKHKRRMQMIRKLNLRLFGIQFKDAAEGMSRRQRYKLAKRFLVENRIDPDSLKSMRKPREKRVVGEDRSTSVWAVGGGLPSLNKRRK